jgi:HSP20 family protein
MIVVGMENETSAERRKKLDEFFGDFDKIEEMIEQMVDELSKMENGEKDGKPGSFGFSVSVSPDGKIGLESLGDVKIEVDAQEQNVPKQKPLVQTVDSMTEFVVTIALPWAKKENIAINAASGKLMITASNESEKIRHTVPLRNDIDEKSAKAGFKNGILEIKFSKLVPEGNAIRIE